MTSSSFFSTPRRSSRYRMCMMFPSLPSSVKFRFIEDDIFRIISERWMTLQTSETETSWDISRMFRFEMSSFRISRCFSRTWRVADMFRMISSVGLR